MTTPPTGDLHTNQLARCMLESMEGDRDGTAPKPDDTPRRPVGDPASRDTGEREWESGKREEEADRREAIADKRERTADEREAIANERERKADKREARLAERERRLDERTRQLGADAKDRQQRAYEAIESARAIFGRGQRASGPQRGLPQACGRARGARASRH